MTKDTTLLFYSFLLCIISGCGGRQTVQINHRIPSCDNPPVTIWIHGTCPPLPSTIELSVKGLPGLHHYTHEPVSKSIGSKIKKIAEHIITSDPDQFDAREFYLYGWSGKLSAKEREHAAQILYSSILELRETYRKRYNSEPHITLITHSHGGNVALNLAQYKESEDALSIQRLILLACPVQERTKHFVHDCFFEKIYSLYSTTDMIQVIDPQGLKNKEKNCPFFSKRRFACSHTCDNIKITYQSRGLLHIDFILKPFLIHLGPLLKNLEEWHDNHALPVPWHQMHKSICIDTKKNTLKRIFNRTNN